LAATSQAVIDIVSADPGAIGYVSMGYLSSQVRAVRLDGVVPTPETVTTGQYPLRTPILFAGLHVPGDDAYRAFFAWVQSQEGQAIVRRHYGALATK
jgi:phosphate transport system substrate-binding protein